MAGRLTWSEVRGLVARELGEPVDQGQPLTALDGTLLDQAIKLTELQADAGVPAGDRDFTG